MAYRPFIDDPEYVARFQGGRFVVIRARGPLVPVFEQVKRRLRQQFPSHALSYIAEAHVTLCGFEKHADLSAVQALAREWAPTVDAPSIAIERVGSFPPPSKVVMLEVRRTPELVAALATIREACARHGLRFTETIPVEAWTFHMSVAYGAALRTSEWEEVAAFAQTIDVAREQCRGDDAEIVAFEGGREYSGGVFPFR
jgi:2'-5' RNA ligase